MITSEDIKYIFILAKLKNGDFFQFAIDKNNKNTYLSVINTLENGLKLIEADFSGTLKVEEPLAIYTEDETIH
jgi:hypothetical protein